MPISEKILNEISQLKTDESFKKMMKKILEEEDNGLSQKAYKAEYKEIVDDYIKLKENQNGSSTNQQD